MAKQLNTKITARMENYSFYHDRMHGYLVRRTGGLTSRQYHQDDRYAAARDASQEFTSVSKAGKLIRRALSEFITPVKDGSMVNRLTKELVALKQLDNTHERGKRRPETMAANSDVNQRLRIFQFNDHVRLYDLLESFSLTDVTTHLHLKAFPSGATHAGIKLVKTIIHFEKETYKTHSSETIVKSKENQEEIILQMNKPALSEGIEITCLQILFYREEQGKLVLLKGKVHSMGIIAISKVSPAVHHRSKQSNKRRKHAGFRSNASIRTPRLNSASSTFVKNHPT